MAKRSTGSSEKSSWLSSELEGCEFEDERLGRRFRTLTEQLWDGIGESIPFACQDWANTKAAYRFLANERVQEAQILAGHFSSTRERFVATDDTVLVLQDTTEFSYEREEPAQIGMTVKVNSGRDKKGRIRHHTVCGILMHSSLAVTTEGLPDAIEVSMAERPLSGLPEETRELRLRAAGVDPVDVTIAFQISPEGGDLAGRDTVHFLLKKPTVGRSSG